MSESSEKPKRSWIKIIAGSVGALMLCCLGMLGIGAYQNSTPEGQATSTARAENRESTQVAEEAEALTEEAQELAQATEEALPTDTPPPTSTSLPTDTPESTDTPQPTPTETPEPETSTIVTVNVSSANIRGGPGTNYPPVATATSGDELTVIALNNQQDWANVQLPDGSLGWVALSITDGDLSDVAIAITIPAPPAVVENPTQPPAIDNPTATPAEPTQVVEVQPTPPPALPPASYNGCFEDSNASITPNYPVRIVNIRHSADPEEVVLQNVSDQPIDLGGWRMCSIRGNQQHDGIGGVLAPGETRTFPYTGGEGFIWSNDKDDDGALYNQNGQLVSYFYD